MFIFFSKITTCLSERRAFHNVSNCFVLVNLSYHDNQALLLHYCSFDSFEYSISPFSMVSPLKEKLQASSIRLWSLLLKCQETTYQSVCSGKRERQRVIGTHVLIEGCCWVIMYCLFVMFLKAFNMFLKVWGWQRPHVPHGVLLPAPEDLSDLCRWSIWLPLWSANLWQLQSVLQESCRR